MFSRLFRAMETLAIYGKRRSYGARPALEINASTCSRGRDWTPLFRLLPLWHHTGVKRIWLIRLILAYLVSAGLVLAPFALPAAAQTMSKQMMVSTMGDMPCCPDEGSPPVKNDCKDCLGMVLCSASSLSTLAAIDNSWSMPAVKVAELRPSNDIVRDGLGETPPARPPRS